jgi:hypothetical protein
VITSASEQQVIRTTTVDNDFGCFKSPLPANVYPFLRVTNFTKEQFNTKATAVSKMAYNVKKKSGKELLR